MKRILVVALATVAVIALAMTGVFALSSDDPEPTTLPTCEQIAEDDACAEDGGQRPADEPAGEPVYDCREVNGTEVCDTFGESDEGPGTK